MRFLIAVIDDRSNSASSNEMAAIDEFNDHLTEKGQMIMACGVEDPSQSKVIDNRAEAGIFEEGPLHDFTEFMAGFWIISASSEEEARDLAAWGSRACNRKVELRKLHG
ncbi:MAG: YciI family protein [Rhodoluna sp.]|nr:YciI family protein [Rhodoluna sp.]